MATHAGTDNTLLSHDAHKNGSASAYFGLPAAAAAATPELGPDTQR